jgi:DinB superfamily
MTSPQLAGELPDLRLYLQEQSAKRTTEEIVVRVNQAVEAVADAVRAISNDRLNDLGSGEGEEWTPVDCLRHVVEWNRMVGQQVLYVALSGELPPPGSAPPLPSTVEGLLATQSETMESLYAHVREADPAAYLHIRWEHPVFGSLNWREWFLFLRLHNLDHANQLKALGRAG